MKIIPALATRLPHTGPVPFQAKLPLRLNNTVSGKNTKSSNPCCIQEMTVLMACFKANDFNQQACSKDITNFQQCFKKYSEERMAREEQEKRGLPVPGDRKMGFRQINEILKKYPAQMP